MDTLIGVEAMSENFTFYEIYFETILIMPGGT